MKLTEPQKEVITCMKEGLYVWAKEGKDFEAWLGDNKGNRIKSIHMKTAESLLRKGRIKIKEWIKFIDGDYKRGIYKYELTNLK